MRKVTVQQMIDSLSRFPMDAPVEVAILQCNQRFAVAHVEPSEVSYAKVGSDKHYAQMIDGQHVRIEARLPENETTYMITQTRKKSK